MPHKMLAHSTVGLKIALGEIIPSSNFFMKLMGKIFKKRIFARESFRKNSPTGKEFIITGDRNFFEEKSTLINYISKCADKGKDAYTKERLTHSLVNLHLKNGMN